ncbi:RNA polymerase sigma factor [Paenibacillus eucommiae]|uniref:RNA polymerase sigma factor n=1 Tax=Paenibacillus eucommiae TaxID=1355755 RepID=A0ABS4J8V1_9BACL|nr:RNA polymerase sigma factor [Paenibacillus eucommiae]MBP1996262.1 RNA polymerase sigma factor (sigma-70 family) [Paenibacillus eucommiae]
MFETRFYKESDETLTVLARNGDREAFDELVVRHRMKAFTWARKITRNHHLTEDIVQDALLRAFLHLGSLTDVARFLPWLRRIVTNQALMRMRRGGPFKKELPLSGYSLPSLRQRDFDVHDMDAIMHYLSERLRQNGCDKEGTNPQLNLERREFIDMIRSLLPCLTERERRVFEARFFEECSPQEIAQLYGLTTSNVYKLISRSRHKIAQERMVVAISNHILRRKEDKNAMTIILDKRTLMEPYQPSVLTFNNLLHHALMLDKPDISLACTEGYLMFAFNINIEQDSVDMSSTNMVDRNYLLYNGLLSLGYKTEYAEAFDFDPPHPDLTVQAIKIVQQSIDLGMPAFVWELINQEFGLIYGYDDETRQFYGIDSKSDTTIPYDRLGTLQTKSLFVLGFADKLDVKREQQVLRMCKMVIRHARGGEATFTGYANGLQGYDAWIDVFNRKSVDPLGQAYTITVIREARGQAAKFLREIAKPWLSGEPWELEVGRLLLEASEQYDVVNQQFSMLTELFPAPTGGEPNNPEIAKKGITIVQGAKASEEAAVEKLERIIELLEQVPSASKYLPVITDPPRAYVM